MNQEILNKYEAEGLPLPFVILSNGETFVSQNNEVLKNEISQMAMVIFETIRAISSIKIETIEVIGDKKGVLMELEDDRVVGSLFEPTEGLVLDNLWQLISRLRAQPSEVAVPKEKPKVRLAPNILDEIKPILKDYLGDFTERIYQNQIKAQHIQPDEIYEEDVRRLIFALGKAAGMIIGPSKGNELTNKLLKIIK